MNDPQSIRINDYSYNLPDDRIAKYPLNERDMSKLLVYKNAAISEDIYRQIHQHIPENAVLIFNNTKVIPARIHFENSSAAKIEIFCLEPANHTEHAVAMNHKGVSRWKCMVKRASKWREPTLELHHASMHLQAEMISKEDDAFIIEFRWTPSSITFAEVLDALGEIPIPPYLNRASEEIDEDRYQTIYSKEEGSVAAPTAGLHFTPQVFESFRSKNISSEMVTLHVGAGTFKPVKAETMEGHNMHSEWLEIDIALIQKLIDLLANNTNRQCLICVGTTSLRSIETLYWMGVKASMNISASIDELEIKQWDAYDLASELSPAQALQALCRWMQKLSLEKLVCKTQILIAPPYQLKMADALITNFHQPNSTLLLLVASVVGPDWKKIYDYALDHDFRFLSYGDGSLLYKC